MNEALFNSAAAILDDICQAIQTASLLCFVVVRVGGGQDSNQGTGKLRKVTKVGMSGMLVIG